MKGLSGQTGCELGLSSWAVGDAIQIGKTREVLWDWEEEIKNSISYMQV